VRSRRAAPRL